MAMNLYEVRRLVRERLDEASPRAWPDDTLNSWINEAARDIARTSEGLFTTFTEAANSTSQSRSIATTSSIVRVSRVEWIFTDGRIRALEYRDMNAMDMVWGEQQTITTGTPEYYTLQGSPASMTALLFPTPSSTGKIRVHYYRMADVATDDADLVDVPDGWEDLVADYAAYKAHMRDGNDQWKDYLGEYQRNLLNLIETTRRYTDQMTVVTPAGTHLPWWVVGDVY